MSLHVDGFVARKYCAKAILYSVCVVCNRQGLMPDDRSLSVLIERYLPLEMRQTLIPVARAGNVVELIRF